MKCLPKCIKCCYNTEMVLTEEDIDRIERLGIDKYNFMVIKEGLPRLKNVEDHCIFLDVKNKRCSIYRYRPLGCRIYPIIYDVEQGFIVDEICPAKDSITQNEFRRKVLRLKELLHNITVP